MTNELNVLRWALPADAASPALAREAVADALRPSHRASLRDDAVLLVSEAVTNAVVHARTPLRVLLHDRGHVVRVEVEDASPDPPVRKHPAPTPPDVTLESGRGLELMERIADAWGVESRRSGKVVWFELNDPDAPVGVDRSRRYVAGWSDRSKKSASPATSSTRPVRSSI